MSTESINPESLLLKPYKIIASSPSASVETQKKTAVIAATNYVAMMKCMEPA